MSRIIAKVEDLPHDNHWDRRAGAAVATQLNRSLNALVDDVIAKGDYKAWEDEHREALRDIEKGLDELGDHAGLAGLSVLLAEINSLKA